MSLPSVEAKAAVPTKRVKTNSPAKPATSAPAKATSNGSASGNTAPASLNGNAHAAPTDTVSLGQSKFDAEVTQDKQLAKMALSNGNAAAAQKQRADMVKGRTEKTDACSKLFTGGINLYNGGYDIANGNYSKGVMELGAGSVELTSAGQTLAPVVKAAATEGPKAGLKAFSTVAPEIPLSELSTLGKVGTQFVKYGGGALSILGTGVNAAEYQAAKASGDVLTQNEKLVDTAASAVSTVTTLVPNATPAIMEAAAAGTVAGAAAGITLAAATGWGIGRTIGSLGADDIVRNAAQEHLYNAGQKELDHSSSLNSSAANLNVGFSDEGLQRLAKAEPRIFAQSVTGAIDRVRYARENGLVGEQGRAQAELDRLRTAMGQDIYRVTDWNSMNAAQLA